jgi:uncharacterized protein (DUF4415 family)
LSSIGDHHMHDPEGVRIYAKQKAVTSRWPTGPANDPGFWERARLVHPKKERVTLRLDADLLAWFRRQGRGYQSRINAILRRHYEHVRERSPT